MGSDPKSPTVLYVEDEESDLLFMQVAFRNAGISHALQAVDNGRDAMDYLSGNGKFANRQEHPLPAMVLLDLNLPVVSGFEVLEWLRRSSSFPDLPVVVFSSSSREEDKAKASELGATDYVEKPGSGLHFGKVVERIKARWLNA